MNQAALVDTYPLPLAQDIFASLAIGKLYLAPAYQQLPLDKGLRPYTTINTLHYTLCIGSHACLCIPNGYIRLQ